jgi:DNA-binding response OmpR family regulator
MAPATVLVVDDDPVILKLLEVNFEMEGFQVVRAADGAEGLERARAVMPDIVILDVMMPRMTGYEVAKALREDDTTAHIPIIFVTARAQSSDVERGMELGVDDYVTKPFDPMDLVARVNALLARTQAAAPPPGSEEGNGSVAPPGPSSAAPDPPPSTAGSGSPPDAPGPAAPAPPSTGEAGAAAEPESAPGADDDVVVDGQPG